MKNYQEKINKLRQDWSKAKPADKKIIEYRANLLKQAYAKAQSQDPSVREIVTAML